jgi:hypothetical protein
MTVLGQKKIGHGQAIAQFLAQRLALCSVTSGHDAGLSPSSLAAEASTTAAAAHALKRKRNSTMPCGSPKREIALFPKFEHEQRPVHWQYAQQYPLCGET